MPLSSPASAPLAASIAGYRLQRPLGRGGLGQVFEASDATGQRIALKLFDLAGDEYGDIAAAFERESALALQLDHPDIVKALKAGVQARTAYIAMEFVAGGDLAQHTAAGTLLPVVSVLAMASRVATALGYAHAMDIVHRDIKPANILIDGATDTVKVADFGVARLGDAFRSRTGVITGTPHYMSPEQLAEGAIDARADLYALGIVLFETLSGQLPHEASSLGTLLRKVATEPAPPLRSVRPELPAELDRLVAALLATRAADRPSSAHAVAQQLAALAAATGSATSGAAGRRAGPKSRH